MDSSVKDFLSANKNQISRIIDKSLQRSATSPLGSWNNCLPIETFKTGSVPYSTHEVTRVFRSSGTTSDQRSQSGFSPEGLDLYKYEAVAAFAMHLDALGLKDPVIVSLIPPTSDWPDSSLAQMLAWFGEFWRLHYTDIQSLPAAMNRPGEHSVLLFATGFHLVELLDSNQAARFPENVWVMETGGTKGRTREVSKTQLYQELNRRFAIPFERILSEYGMSELACQAYYADRKSQTYQFPPHVRTFVEVEYKTLASAGTGCLAIYDPLRLDVAKIIRTQDVVALEANGHFRLLGRAESAPLKGCSLPFEKPTPNFRGFLNKHTAPNAVQSLSAFLEHIKEFFASDRLCRAWETEFGNLALARQAQIDVLRSLPADVDAFRHALTKAGFDTKTPQNWLVISPATHSLAVMYPISFLGAHGCNIQLRLPANTNISQSLKLFVDFLAQHLDVQVTTLPDSWRIEDHETEDRAIMIFGSNETIAHVSSYSHNQIYGFGTAISCTYVRQKADLHLALADLFSLRRRGCMSSRTLFVDQDIQPGDLMAVAKEYLAQQQLTPTPCELSGAFCDALGLELNGWQIMASPNLVLAHKPFSAQLNLNNCLAAASFVLPVIHTANWQEFSDWFRRQADARADHLFLLSSPYDSLNDLPDNLCLSKLSLLNSQPWDGNLFGRPLVKTE